MEIRFVFKRVITGTRTIEFAFFQGIGGFASEYMHKIGLESRAETSNYLVRHPSYSSCVPPLGYHQKINMRIADTASVLLIGMSVV